MRLRWPSSSSCSVLDGRVAAVGPGKLAARRVRGHVGRDENDELALAPAVVVAAEQRAQHGNVLEARHAFHALARLVRQQARHGQRAAARQLQGGLGAAHLEGGNGKIVEG